MYIVNVTVFCPQPSVFNRLGGKTAVKRPATSTSVEADPDEPPLEYAGVLKSSPTPVKKTKVTITNNKKYASLGKITISNKTVTSATGKIMEKTVTTKKLLVTKKPGRSNVMVCSLQEYESKMSIWRKWELPGACTCVSLKFKVRREIVFDNVCS